MTGVDPAFVSAHPPDPAGGAFTWSRRNYFLKLPTGYDQTTPYIVTIGGTGCSGNDTVGVGGGYYLDQYVTAAKTETLDVSLSYVDYTNTSKPTCFADDYTNSPEPQYLDAILADLESKYCVDRGKVFLHGHSSGAWEALTLGCARADVLRGVATQVGGGLRMHRPPCEKMPVATIYVEGLMDTDNPIGPLSPTDPTAIGLDSLGSAPARDDLLTRNGCVGNANKPWDAAYPACVTYTGCPAAAPVVWCAIASTHTISANPALQTQYAYDAIWKFWTGLRVSDLFCAANRARVTGAVFRLLTASQHVRVSARDLVVRHHLERLGHARVIPLRAAVRGGHVEELCADRRHGQAERHLARAGERQVEILLVQLDAEAGLEVALHHALAVHLEDLRVREAAHERLAHARRVGARLRREEQRLAHGLDGRRDDDLVRDLARLPVAVAAHERDVLAHELEERLDRRERHLAAAHHDRQRRALGADLAARHGRVEVLAAELVDALGELLGLAGRDRRHVDDDLPLRQTRRDAVVAEERGRDVRRVRHHRDDDVALLGDLLARLTHDGARARELRGDRAEVMDRERVAALQEVARHGLAHDSDADESDFAHD